MAEMKQPTGLKKGHVAARLWTAARDFFGAKRGSKSKSGLAAAIEANNTVGGVSSHTDSKKLVGFIHPGGFVVLTPQRRSDSSDDLSANA
jgi:hypothetical protein